MQDGVSLVLAVLWMISPWMLRFGVGFTGVSRIEVIAVAKAPVKPSGEGYAKIHLGNGVGGFFDGRWRSLCRSRASGAFVQWAARRSAGQQHRKRSTVRPLVRRLPLLLVS